MSFSLIHIELLTIDEITHRCGGPSPTPQLIAKTLKTKSSLSTLSPSILRYKNSDRRPLGGGGGRVMAPYLELPK
jgi:hypothetical protein